MATVNPSTPPPPPPHDSDDVAPQSSSHSSYSLPLYDPHGLGTPNFDDAGPSSRLWSRNEAGESPLKQQSSRVNRRGRRRRSSEAIQSVMDASDRDEEFGDESSSRAAMSRNVTAPLLWWQRPREEQEGQDETAQSSKMSKLPPIHTSGKVETSTSPASSLRSPAAAFLSSMNETLGSPPSNHQSSINESARSVSPSLSNSQIHRTSMPIFPSQQGENDSSFGIASAAASIYNATQGTSSRAASSFLRPDEEGARIGPNGRFLLGRTIGFGGFSTIREAWDLGPQADVREVTDKDGAMHRVAVKIVYSADEAGVDDAALEDEELQIWETIPAHPNLLPLLHHERITTKDTSRDSERSAISFLVMPYCEGSLLAYVKSEGILPEKAVASSDYSLSRSASLQSNKGVNARQNDPSLPQQQPQSRTGSGFIPRSAGMRVASVPLSNLLGYSPSRATATTSTSIGPTSSVLRRGSSRLSRNQPQSSGVPFQKAQEVMQQLTEALLCLHTKAGTLHGDLKLENVLGQRSISRSFQKHRDDKSTEGEYDSEEEEFRQMQSDGETFARETICWRVADFGLARRVLPSENVKKSRRWQRQSDHTPNLTKLEERMLKARQGKATVGGAGGSLAYASPELFLPNMSLVEKEDDSQAHSAFASDMWALGCILYVLCSGKLPFTDSFEPRLQMKIAKGKWDMPIRLKRRNERKASNLNKANINVSRERERERERSSSGNIASDNLAFVNNFSSSLMSTKPFNSTHSVTGSRPTVDMSASMPALQDRHYFENGGVRSNSEQSILVHDSTDEIYPEETPEEHDSDSDADEQIDQEMDGKSQDRVGIRLALKKLLEPDPTKRWTIEQLASLPWISGGSTSTAPFSGMETSQFQSSVGRHPASGMDFFMGRRPSLAHGNISEHPSQEAVVSSRHEDDEEERDVYDDDDYVGRGRPMRREIGEDINSKAAKPIDIDRSSSRSRSRPRPMRNDSSPWDLGSSFEKSLLQDVAWQQGVPTRRQEQRSSSADAHSLLRGRSTSSKGRRSVSRPPRLDLLKNSVLDGRREGSPTTTSVTKESDESVSRSSTSRSRSRARDALHEIASRKENTSPIDDRLWWQRGRKGPN